MEHFREGCGWPYEPATHPNGDVVRAPRDTVSEYMSHTVIKCPAYFRGYTYSYNAHHELVRRPVVGYQALHSALKITDVWYNTHMGMNFSKAMYAFHTLILDLRLLRHKRLFAAGAFDRKFGASRVRAVHRGLRRLRKTPIYQEETDNFNMLIRNLRTISHGLSRIESQTTTD